MEFHLTEPGRLSLELLGSSGSVLHFIQPFITTLFYILCAHFPELCGGALHSSALGAARRDLALLR